MANRLMNIIPINIPREQSRMGRFSSRKAILPASGAETSVAALVPDETVEFIKTNLPERIPSVVLACLRQTNRANLPPLQVCAYYLSAIRAIFTGLDSTIVEAMRNVGADLDILTDAQLGPGLFELGENPGRLHCVIMVAASVLILFKNINAASFVTYFSNRVKALKGLAGLLGPLTTSGDIVVKLEAAEIIRGVLGAQHKLRIALLDTMLVSSSDDVAMGNAFGYITSMLEWTDMSSLVFICEVLLVPRSPVIRDRRVVSEVKALSHVFSMVNSSDSPKFFRIYNPVAGGRLMDRGKFPIILAVAKICKSSRHTPANFFATSTVGNQLIMELVDVHNTYMEQTRRIAAPIAVRHLFEFDPEAEDDEARAHLGRMEAQAQA